MELNDLGLDFSEICAAFGLHIGTLIVDLVLIGVALAAVMFAYRKLCCVDGSCNEYQPRGYQGPPRTYQEGLDAYHRERGVKELSYNLRMKHGRADRPSDYE